jgi:hypothetical protein
VAKKKAKKKAAKKVAKKKAKKAAKAVTGVMVSSGGVVAALTGDKSIHDIIRRINEERANSEEKAKDTFRELAPKLFLNCVAKVHVEYDGEGDSGDIQHIAYIDINDNDVPHALSEDDEERLKSAIWPFVPSGFENNEGGFGNIYIDLKNNSVLCEHSERIIETNDSSKEFKF